MDIPGAASMDIDDAPGDQLDEETDYQDLDLDREEIGDADLYEEMNAYDGDTSPFATYNQIR